MAKKINAQARLAAKQDELKGEAAAATEHADYLETQIEGLREEASTKGDQAAAVAQALAILTKAGVTEF